MPSPCRHAGFVVSLNTCPAPPVARSVARGAHFVAAPGRVEVRNSAGESRPRRVTSVTSAVIDRCDRRERADPSPEHAADLASGRIARHAVPAVRLCAASRPSAGRPSAARFESRTPFDQLSRTSCGPCSTRTRTAASSHSPSPRAESYPRHAATGLLRRRPSPAAMPPCA
jgi:hypothetical protein